MQCQLALPSSPSIVLEDALKPALGYLPAKMGKPNAVAEVLAIGYQESDGYRSRLQYQGGPARGLWQNEKGGGVKGVMTHPASRDFAAMLCNIREVVPTVDAVYTALAYDDVLAAGMARLLLWTDAAPLPTLGDAEGSFLTYIRVWRPGAFTRGNAQAREALRAKFHRAYQLALEAITGTDA
jgi:hypothetical protein